MTAYTELDSNAPAGSSDPTTYSGKDIANIRALRDMAITGRANGFVYSQSGGADSLHPATVNYINATLVIGFRQNITWGGTGGHQLATIQWQWNNIDPSNAASANWTNMGSAQVNTYDGSNNIASSTNSGGFATILWSLWTRIAKAVGDLATHIAATGTSVHGLANMATQTNTAVNIDGGNIDGTAVGDTTRARGSFTRVAEDSQDYAPALNAGVIVDWSHGGSNITTSGTNAITFSNIPAAGILSGHLVEIDNFNNVTWPGTVDFGLGGRPSIAGRAVVCLETRDGGASSVKASIYWRQV